MEKDALSNKLNRPSACPKKKHSTSFAFFDIVEEVLPEVQSIHGLDYSPFSLIFHGKKVEAAYQEEQNIKRKSLIPRFFIVFHLYLVLINIGQCIVSKKLWPYAIKVAFNVAGFMVLALLCGNRKLQINATKTCTLYQICLGISLFALEYLVDSNEPYERFGNMTLYVGGRNIYLLPLVGGVLLHVPILSVCFVQSGEIFATIWLMFLQTSFKQLGWLSQLVIVTPFLVENGIALLACYLFLREHRINFAKNLWFRFEENKRVREEMYIKKEILRQKGQYIAQVAHDIGTPLTTFSLTLELLKGGFVCTTEQQDILETAQCAVELMTVTRMEALDHAKHVEGLALRPNINEVDLRKLIKKCARIMAGYAGACDLPMDFFLEPEPTLPAIMMTDYDWIWTMVVNYLSNARKYSARGRIVTTVFRSPSLEMFQVEVADEGKGVPNEQKSKLFQPFRQLQSGAGGTGLGLHGVSIKAKALGGKVGVRDNPFTPTGSIFWFQVPFKDAIGSPLVTGKLNRVLVVGPWSELTHLDPCLLSFLNTKYSEVVVSPSYNKVKTLPKGELEGLAAVLWLLDEDKLFGLGKGELGKFFETAKQLWTANISSPPSVLVTTTWAQTNVPSSPSSLGLHLRPSAASNPNAALNYFRQAANKASFLGRQFTDRSLLDRSPTNRSRNGDNVFALRTDPIDSPKSNKRRRFSFSNHGSERDLAIVPGAHAPPTLSSNVERKRKLRIGANRKWLSDRTCLTKVVPLQLRHQRRKEKSSRVKPTFLKENIELPQVHPTRHQPDSRDNGVDKISRMESQSLSFSADHVQDVQKSGDFDTSRKKPELRIMTSTSHNFEMVETDVLIAAQRVGFQTAYRFLTMEDIMAFVVRNHAIQKDTNSTDVFFSSNINITEKVKSEDQVNPLNTEASGIRKHIFEEEKECSDADILVVDDDSSILKFLTKMLNKNGYRVRGEKNGFEGLNALKSKKFKAAFIDRNMPVMDGLECIKSFRAWESIHLQQDRISKQYIAMVSANAYDDDIKEALESGANDFISKPVKVQLLLECVECAKKKEQEDLCTKAPGVHEVFKQRRAFDESNSSTYVSDIAMEERSEKGQNKDETLPWDTSLTVAQMRKTVLIVDDEPSILKFTKKMLEKHKFHVHTATNGSEALEKMKENFGRYSAAVIDMTMPVMGGRECITSYREWEKRQRMAKCISQRNKLCIILLSGHDPETLGDIEADAFECKPIQVQKIIETISLFSVQKEGCLIKSN